VLASPAVAAPRPHAPAPPPAAASCPPRNAFRGRNREDLRNFPFCDDAAAAASPAAAAAAAPRPPIAVLRPAWEEESALDGCVQLVEAALGASSTDDDSQAASRVLRNDRGFWSSTGSEGRGGSEWLLFRLRGPLCRIDYVRVAVYRALYQAG
jgi:hypothetical protein